MLSNQYPHMQCTYRFGLIVGMALTAGNLFAALPSAPLPMTGHAQPNLVAFDALLIGFLRAKQVPGAALAVVRDSRLVLARGYGWADIEAQEPVRPASLFRIASLSKPITAVLTNGIPARCPVLRR